MKFPPHETADSTGLLVVGGDLSPEVLVQAYSLGIFPWPQKDVPLLWFSPPERGVLFFNKFSIPKSVQKIINKKTFEIKINSAFDQVIKNCAKIPRNEETGTWILPEMLEAYIELNKQGHAISVEAWSEGKLVGGLYGVLIKNVFSGESMFFKESGASKVCIVFLIEHLKTLGHEWIDIQMVTPVLKQFGGEYISRKKFLTMLLLRQS